MSNVKEQPHYKKLFNVLHNALSSAVRQATNDLSSQGQEV